MLINKGVAFSTRVLLSVLVSSFSASAGPQTAVELLFESKHLSELAPGAQVAYRFDRIVSDPKLLGESFSDEIKLVVTNVAPTGADVALSIFSGERARSIQKLANMVGNPVLIVFLDRALNNMSQLAGIARPYLKDRTRAGLRENAVLEPIELSYNGNRTQAFRITLMPFEGDPSSSKMLGYERSKFTFVVSETVPGKLVEMTSDYHSTVPGAPGLEERITVLGTEATP
jgi:hypothetical protein